MQSYINPYHLLKLQVDDPDQVDHAVVRRARRKLLADFELSDDIVIDYEGNPLNKSSALQAIQDLEDPKMRGLHWEISQNGVLREFLEKGNQNALLKLPPPTTISPELQQFISPWFAPQFDRLLSETLKTYDLRTTQALIQQLGYLHPYEQDRAFRGALRHFNGILAEIEALDEYNINEVSDGKIQRYIKPELLQYLNLLPRNYQNTRNRYAGSLCKLSVLLFNSHHLNQSYEVINAAAEIQSDHATRERVQNLQSQIRVQVAMDNSRFTQERFRETFRTQASGNRTFSGSGGDYSDYSGKNNSGTVVGVVMVLLGLFLAIGIMSQKGRPSRKPYKTPSFTYQPPSLPDFKAMEQNRKAMENISNLFNNDQGKLYTALNEFRKDRKRSPDPKNKQNKNLKLSTGDQPYLGLLSEEYNPDDSISFIRFTNRSPKDCIVFLENPLTRGMVWHAYIRKNEKYAFIGLPRGMYRAKIYRGKSWNPSAIRVKNQELGAFEEAADEIPYKSGFNFSLKETNPGMMAGKYPRYSRGETYYSQEVTINSKSYKSKMSIKKDQLKF